MEANSFDIVLSMNGFHAFPDKKKAFRETHRVLKPGGKEYAEPVLKAIDEFMQMAV